MRLSIFNGSPSGVRTRVTGVKGRINQTEQEQEIIINIYYYNKLMCFNKNLTIPENTSKYPSEDGVYFLCTSIIE